MKQGSAPAHAETPLFQIIRAAGFQADWYTDILQYRLDGQQDWFCHLLNVDRELTPAELRRIDACAWEILDIDYIMGSARIPAPGEPGHVALTLTKEYKDP